MSEDKPKRSGGLELLSDIARQASSPPIPPGVRQGNQNARPATQPASKESNLVKLQRFLEEHGANNDLLIQCGATQQVLKLCPRQMYEVLTSTLHASKSQEMFAQAQTPAQHSATGAFNMRMEDNATMGMNDAYAGMQGFGGQWMSQQMSKPGQGMVMGTQMTNGAGQASGLQMQLRQEHFGQPDPRGADSENPMTQMSQMEYNNGQPVYVNTVPMAQGSGGQSQSNSNQAAQQRQHMQMLQRNALQQMVMQHQQRMQQPLQYPYQPMPPQKRGTKRTHPHGQVNDSQNEVEAWNGSVGHGQY